MTLFLLLRHAAHDLLGKVLAGRASGVHLNAQGKFEAKRLAERLVKFQIKAIYAGPLERVQETASPLAKRCLLSTSVSEAFDELDFGEWTFLTFAELDLRPDWQEWNEFRDRAIPPRGEGMLALQGRVTRELERLTLSHDGETVAIVSHAEVIKTALMHYLGIPMAFHSRLEIDPASVSVLQIHEGQPQIVAINRLT